MALLPTLGSWLPRWNTACSGAHLTTYRISPLAVICPLCGADPGEPCRITHLGDKGTGKHRSAPHQQRCDAADVANIPNARAAQIEALEREIRDLIYASRRAKPNSQGARYYPEQIEELEARLEELRNLGD